MLKTLAIFKNSITKSQLERRNLSTISPSLDYAFAQQVDKTTRDQLQT